MTQPHRYRWTSFVVVMLWLAVCLSHAHAQENHPPDGLKTIDGPGGGSVVYGPVSGQATPQGAMAAVLRYVHGKFGDRPQIGAIFQTRDSQTFGTSFNLVSKSQGNKALAGLVIISMATGTQPAAAVLYDEAPRFARTQPILMQKLDEAWHAASASPPSSSGNPADPPPLRMTTGGDHSASIGLPAGWQITGVSGGQLTAEGPNGERVGLGIIYQQIHDPRNAPAYGNAGGGPPLVYPFGGDLFNAYVSLTNQMRQRNHLPPASFQLIGSKSLPATQFEGQVIEARFDLDLHDGKGPRTGSARIGEMHTRGTPTYAMTISGSNLPKTVASAEASTMLAVIHSYSQDARVINGELQQTLRSIQAIGERSRQQAAAADARREASAAAFNAHMDNIDRMSKSFQNYVLDRTEIQDNARGERGAIDNSTAAALIQSDPSRFQSVPTQSFLKGADF